MKLKDNGRGLYAVAQEAILVNGDFHLLLVAVVLALLAPLNVPGPVVIGRANAFTL